MKYIIIIVGHTIPCKYLNKNLFLTTHSNNMSCEVFRFKYISKIVYEYMRSDKKLEGLGET